MAPKEIKYPSISSIRESSLLGGLNERAEIFDAIIDPTRPEKFRPEIEEQIFGGTQELIDIFNGLYANEPALSIPSLSRTRALKLKVGTLPDITDLNDPREIAFSLVNGANRMLDGQINKGNKQMGNEITEEAVDKAIGTPSMDIPPIPKAIGSTLHFIERAMFAHFRNSPKSVEKPELNQWKKDEILFALEDMAQLRHVLIQLGLTNTQETILFHQINTSNAEGGLGWRKPENLETMANEFSSFKRN